MDSGADIAHALRGGGLPVAASILAAPDASAGVHALAAFIPTALKTLGLAFPMIVKPMRGRGSQGITLVDDHASFMRAATGGPNPDASGST